MKFKEQLIKLQSLPENRKKIILWTIVAIMATIMGFFWAREAIYVIPKIGESIQKVELPEINTQGMPNINLEEIGNQIKNSSGQVK